MKPRPVHRWKSFWLGVVVLVFLCWAWARSISRVDLVGHGDRVSKKSWSVSSSGGAIRYLHMDLSKAELYDFSPGPGGWRTGSGQMQSKGPWFPAAIEARRKTKGMPSREVDVAYWLVVLGFAVSWGSMLMWRRWRMRRVAAVVVS